MTEVLKRLWICALGLLATPVWAAAAGATPELLFRASADGLNNRVDLPSTARSD